MTNNELKHYGVPGMKWGVRRKLTKEARASASQRVMKKRDEKVNDANKRMQEEEKRLRPLARDLAISEELDHPRNNEINDEEIFDELWARSTTNEDGTDGGYQKAKADKHRAEKQCELSLKAISKMRLEDLQEVSERGGSYLNYLKKKDWDGWNKTLKEVGDMEYAFPHDLVDDERRKLRANRKDWYR